ncbi:MAG: bifunctional phosphoribosylaminoimidazolecarboxamide formyltransferase/IMP cyclohydrolase [Gammaproteobacteria bacterium]|jgi:phosphoribosylaminoimidazolecarboxamide formyltransferase/IMP cyclohydrolase|nr:bifunctional phosphoribosylaminoimidazolecarboxamide formyltransferase/IMP cyclohydrolase [Gammaproteobacteria bacterium]
MSPPRRALISVSDKTGVVELARGLADGGFQLLSTGGTARALREAGLEVTDIAAYTGFPEIMDGRVKTLHPKVHGGLLGRRDTDAAVMAEHGIDGIDVLAVNLYPFEETVSAADVSLADAVENIDIGGPAMIRAAAKNHRDVMVLVDPQDYEAALAALREGTADEALRLHLAAKAYTHTASYDAAISAWLTETAGESRLGERFACGGRRIATLRYGENPHQRAAFYADAGDLRGTLAGAEQVQGKELSYNNIADADAALECVRQFDGGACVIVKHANPCGVAVAGTQFDAYDRAYATDPVSAFGGIIAFNSPLEKKVAHEILHRQFVEVIVAPALAGGAAEVLAAKKNVRVLVTGETRPERPAVELKKVSGGLLVQDRDDGSIGADALRVVSRREPGDAEIADLLFAWRVAKYVKSNAIVFARGGATVGVGAGQMSRVYSTRIAAIKAADAGLSTKDAVVASDAFFPFRDGIDSAAEHGVRAVIQPGGSVRDEEVIAAADEHGIAMVLTGMRHFRH